MSISVKDQLAKLVQLQNIDINIYKFNEEINEFPKTIDTLSAIFEEKKKAVQLIEDKIKDSLKRRKEKELEMAVKEESIKKQTNQLGLLKTNKEYQAMLKEIEGAKADCSVFEDVILKFMDEVDSLKNDLEKEKVKFQEEEKSFSSEKVRINARIQDIEKEIKSLETKRLEITPHIDKKILSAYERILKNKDGLAIVSVKNNACQGCFMNVTAQVINEIKMFERITVCEMCARILYIEDEIDSA
jgi:uncharacterized protein